jgi:hypothetical protein
MDEGVQLAKPMPPPPMKLGWQDWRSQHGACRVGQRGEDGDTASWETLLKTAGIKRMDAMYAALKPGPIWYGAAVLWLEEQQGREMAKIEAPKKDWRPVLLAFLQTKNPTPVQAKAIAHLREIAKERGVYSLNLAKAVNGIREVLPEPTDATIAATMGADDSLVKRLIAKGFLK